MALGRSPEYHWNQIISKSVHRLSRSGRLKLFSIYSPGAILFNERNGLSNFCRQSPKEHSCMNYFKIHALAKEEKSFEGFLLLALVAIFFNDTEKLEQF